MTESSSPYGQICWFEVPVKSVSRASAFYLSVLGWECNDLEGTPSPTGRMKSVHMFNRGTLHGAFLLLPDDDAAAEVSDAPKACVPVATFMVESINETVKKIGAAGGTIFIPRTEIGGGMGWFAQFIDTEGNVQGIWAKE